MKFQLHADGCNYIKDPVNSKWDKIVLYVRAASIPKGLLGWMEVNPRGQNMERSKVREIRESLSINDHFHVLNRGVGMNVAAHDYDDQAGILTVEVADKNIHGIIDGGHSLRTILEAKQLSNDRFISFEIFCVGEADIRQLSRARNTTVEVDLRSLANLEQEFDFLQELFAPLPFADRILYKTNDEGKDIDIQDVLSIVFMFCDKVFPLDDDYCIRHKPPEEALKLYLSLTGEQRAEFLLPMAPILPDLFVLWDRIELEFVRKMPHSKRNGELLVASKRFMEGRGSKVKERKGGTTTLFSRTPTPYWVSVDIIRPLMAANAALVEITDDGTYAWKRDPLEMWEQHAVEQVATIMGEKAPIKTSKLIWCSLYMTYKIEVRRGMLK